ncbi:unnamed protein product [Owenia fusiformis]|nr:unnamed protein product [Owenia fusiformis]
MASQRLIRTSSRILLYCQSKTKPPCNQLLDQYTSSSYRYLHQSSKLLCNDNSKLSPSSRSNEQEIDYFRKLVRDSKDTSNNIMLQDKQDQTDDNPEEHTVMSHSENQLTTHLQGSDDIIVDDENQIDISSLRPAPKPISLNLAPYVNNSETLSSLVKLGVDLSKLEKAPDVADKLVQKDFERDIKPYIMFLNDNDVPAKKLGVFITKNPRILNQDLEHLQTRINYLESKKFTKADIATILQKAPLFLNFTTYVVDRKLGHLQKEFKLTGAQVRQVTTHCPKLVTWPLDQLKHTTLQLSDFCGFTGSELKEMLLLHPKLYLTAESHLLERFDYVHNTMNISHELISKYCRVLRTRLKIIKSRHLFLKSLNKDQYDPTKPNYISLQAIVLPYLDNLWCRDIADVPVQEYNDFLKTL